MPPTALEIAPTGARAARMPLARALVEVVVPVYNEAATLDASIRRLHGFLDSGFPFDWRITIADNASTDTTLEIARRLSRTLSCVGVVHLTEKGRGRALRAAWSASDADVVAYMDVDLSTGLEALLPLVAPLLSGHSDVAIGTRLAHGSRVTRGPKREFISRSYNRLLKASLRTGFSDAQCGFKAIRRAVADDLLAAIENERWFFDTELLVLAERNGLRIHEVPVDWIDDPDSRVDIVATALEDLRGIARLRARMLTGNAKLGAPPTVNPRRGILTFAAIGLVSTLAYALLFLALRGPVGSGAANVLALALTAVANTAANRRLTFGVRGKENAARHHLQGLIVFALGVALTSGALAMLHALAPGASALLELAVLLVASAVATLMRYVLLRSWVFAAARAITGSGM